jgi:spoIIIJ-associated protein
MELTIKNAALDLLAGLRVDEGSVRVEREESSDSETEHFRVLVATTDAPLLIGRRGETLQSFQHLLRLIVDQKAAAEKLNYRVLLTVDIDGYRERQVEETLELAERLAAKVQETGNPVRLRPLGAYLRRAVHLFIAEKFPELVTESAGYGREKPVTIKKK